MKLKIKKVRQSAILPEFGSAGAAGMDFFADLDGISEGLLEYIVMPGEIVKIPLGVAVELEPGHELQIRNRSGITMKGVIVHLGTVDEDYRGEISAMVHNMSTRAFVIDRGFKLCQGVVAPVCNLNSGLEFDIVEELSDTERGEKGFGSTGTIAVE